MSNKRCAKCEKTVYPLEELKCLDKIWHKTCFKCWECGMTLSMKNYKGFDKKPYCNAHVPKARHTQVAKTPEMARLAENTRIQSQVKYHADFEKMKGTKISVTDDPESARVKENQNVVSQVKYWGLQDKQKDMEGKRAMMQRDPNHPAVETQQYKTRPASSEYTQEEYRPSPHQSRSQGSTIYNSSEGGKVENAPTRRVGSISDYDPMNDQWGSLTTPTGGYGSAPGARQSAGGHQQQSWSETVSAPAPAGAPPPQQHSPRYEPEQRNYYPPPSQPQYEPPPPQQPPQQQYNPPPPAVVSPPASSNGSKSAVIYQAMYDYEAGDDDEVGFMDGDRIIDVEPIDAGWMIGTVQRTGQRGMLPANYVEKL